MITLQTTLSLEDLITEKIISEGTMCFRDYMEMALYHPELGYYSGSKEKFGVGGDFFTSPEYSPVFGHLIAVQLREMWQNIGSTRFTVVEYGAGSGALCESILDHFKKEMDLYPLLDYVIVEKSQGLKQHQQARLPDKVKWINELSELGVITGCVLSNEVVDNFAVHKVRMNEGLKEVHLVYDNCLREEVVPANERIHHYFEELKIKLSEGFITEVNLQALDWMKDIVKHLEMGYVMTIDYGYPSSELYADCRKSGTLTCYHKHRVNYQLYENVGEQDITSHVNFSALCLWGHKYGLDYLGFRNQGNFLMALGFNENLKKIFNSDPKKQLEKEKRALKLVGEMGNKFKVLVQAKGVTEKSLLGMKAN